MAEINLEHIKSTINPSFYPLMSDKSRYLILRGGGGSGKSFALAQKVILRCIFAEQNEVTQRILCCRKTNPDVRRSVFSLIKHYINLWNLNSICRINRTEMTFTFKNGSKILCTGLDEPEKLKSIHSITSIWLEEATEFSLEDFTQCDLRLRGTGITDYFQIMMSFNPISKQNWIYKEFYEDDEKIADYQRHGFTEHHSTYRDNQYLDDAYISKLQSYENISPYIYQVYTLGHWGVLSGLIYDNNWEVIPANDPSIPKTTPLFGLDFGYNHQTALVEIRKRVRDNTIFVRELLYQKGWTNKQLILWIKRNMKPSNLIVCDRSPDRIKELQQAGIKAVGARKGQDSIFDGIDYLKRMQIKIIAPSQNLINEISGYQWKLDKNNEPMDVPIMVNDHLMDAMRYPCWTKWGYAASTPSIVWV